MLVFAEGEKPSKHRREPTVTLFTNPFGLGLTLDHSGERQRALTTLATRAENSKWRGNTRLEGSCSHFLFSFSQQVYLYLYGNMEDVLYFLCSFAMFEQFIWWSLLNNFLILIIDWCLINNHLSIIIFFRNASIATTVNNTYQYIS